MPLALPIDQAAAECGVSAKTLKREIAAGHLPVARIRGRQVVLLSDLSDYLQARRSCPSARTTANSKPAYSTPVVGLAALLRLDATRKNGSAANAPGSKITELAAHRATASKRRSPAG